MKPAWASIRVIWWILTLVTSFAALVLSIAAIFTGHPEWISSALLLMLVFYLPATFEDLVRFIRNPKPRPPPRLVLSRWPFVLLGFMIVPLYGWAVCYAFGRVWMGALAACCLGLPMIAWLASLILMEDGPRKERVNLTCILAMIAIPMLMMIVFAVVYGRPVD
jgi:hypothetical protein